MAKKSMKSAVRAEEARNRQQTNPLSVSRTTRGHEVRTFTSLPAGKCVPIVAVPLLREDAVRRGRMSFSFEMHETAEIIMNGVLVRVQAHLVPWLAFERFEGSMDIFNKAYAGEYVDRYGKGGVQVEFFENRLNPGTSKILRYLGLHGAHTTHYNVMYDEAYNLIYNHRATNRSDKLPLRPRLEKSTLADAFWIHNNYRQIVPDYEQGLLDGELSLELDDTKLPVKSFWRGAVGGGYAPSTPGSGVVFDGEAKRWDFGDQVYAELEGAGITLNLANIQLARKTQAFAKMRQRYSGHDDDYIINLLMDGIRLPDEQLKQPVKVGQKTSVFGMAKRYATDGTNLDESVVNGMTSVTMDVNIPRLNTGGILMFTAEIMPEQLFERQKDPFLHLSDVDELPEFMRDYLDPEPVEVVPNDYLDVRHNKPDDTFGYQPLNAKWNISASRVGGRYYRPNSDTSTDQDRQRLWAVENLNPVLDESFYLCKDIHLKPFVSRTTDPFDVVAIGGFQIEGNTVFGPHLVEDNNEYEDVLEEAPEERNELPEPANT